MNELPDRDSAGPPDLGVDHADRSRVATGDPAPPSGTKRRAGSECPRFWLGRWLRFGTGILHRSSPLNSKGQPLRTDTDPSVSFMATHKEVKWTDLPTFESRLWISLHSIKIVYSRSPISPRPLQPNSFHTIPPRWTPMKEASVLCQGITLKHSDTRCLTLHLMKMAKFTTEVLPDR